ncbi:MAG: DOMON domain-containing protein [Planctomycetota bacterium]
MNRRFAGRPGFALVVWGLLILCGSPNDSGAQEKSPVCPNGLSMDRIRGYEDWTFLTAHLRTDKKQMRYLLGNDRALASFRDGAGPGGKKFAEGSIIVKIKYDLIRNPAHAASIEPRQLVSVEYMVKDTQAFPDTDGWGYAAYPYHPQTGTFSAAGDSPTFHHACHRCHTEKVAHKDFVFTDYKHPKFIPWEKRWIPKLPDPLKSLDALEGGAQKTHPEHEEKVVPVRASAKALKEVTLDGVLEEGEYPVHAALGGGAVVLHWRILGDEIAFGVEGKTAGWIAIGFGASSAMKDADMIVGWVDASGKAVVRDEFCTGPFGPHDPDVKQGGRNDILAFGGVEKDGVTVLEFRRKIDPGDKFDKPIPTTAPFELLWALGGKDDPATKHTRRGEAELTLEAGDAVEKKRPLLWPIHAVLMDLCTLFLLASMAIARRRSTDKLWLPKHQTLGIVSAILLLVGLGVAVYMVGFSSGDHFRVPHAFFGAAALLLALTAPILGGLIFRAPESRATLRTLHVLVGRLAILLLILSSVSGLLHVEIF